MNSISASTLNSSALDLIRKTYEKSKPYRIVLILTGIYVILRLFMFFYTAYTSYVPQDMEVYLEAGRNFAQHRALYPPLPLETPMPYQYSPLFAALMVPFAVLPEWLTILIQSLLHMIAYGGLYLVWHRIFGRLSLLEAQTKLAWFLPAWLIFSQFWDDLSYLNVYVIVALFASLLIEALIIRRLWSALLWLAIILQIKPHWAFPVLLLLMTGHYKFFLKLMLISIGIYAACVGITALLSTPEYALGQYQSYAVLLSQANTYPLRIAGQDPMLGYNHSIRATLVYFLGSDSSILLASTILKYVLITPLIVILLREVIRPPKLEAYHQLILIFALYTGLFIWLDVVWELTLVIPVFVYLLAYLNGRSLRIMLWAVLIPYIFVDFWRLLTYIILGEGALVNDAYVVTDPFSYLPLVMVINLGVHSTLLWQMLRLKSEVSPVMEPG